LESQLQQQSRTVKTISHGTVTDKNQRNKRTAAIDVVNKMLTSSLKDPVQFGLIEQLWVLCLDALLQNKHEGG
jgi:hypothetical protein